MLYRSGPIWLFAFSLLSLLFILVSFESRDAGGGSEETKTEELKMKLTSLPFLPSLPLVRSPCSHPPQQRALLLLCYANAAASPIAFVHLYISFISSQHPDLLRFSPSIQTIIPLFPPSISDSKHPCLSCTKSFCLDQKLEICKGASGVV